MLRKLILSVMVWSLIPAALVKEMQMLEGISLDNFFISEIAHVIMPYHRLLDKLEEERKGEGKSVQQARVLARPIPIR